GTGLAGGHLGVLGGGHRAGPVPRAVLEGHVGGLALDQLDEGVRQVAHGLAVAAELGDAEREQGVPGQHGRPHAVSLPEGGAVPPAASALRSATAGRTLLPALPSYGLPSTSDQPREKAAILALHGCSRDTAARRAGSNSRRQRPITSSLAGAACCPSSTGAPS